MKKEGKYLIYNTPRQRKTIKQAIKYMLYVAYFALCKVILMFYRPRRKQAVKYNTTICAIFKNEGPYLKEWIEYHKLVGVEHFYLYNNNSDDNYMKILEPYIEEGSVDLIDWPEAHAQMAAYRNCIERFASDSEWIGFIDLDEFVVPKEEESIPAFLKRFAHRPAVMIYWKMYGSSGRVDRDLKGLVTEDFTVCWGKHTDTGKCFYNTAYRFAAESKRNDVFMHIFWTKIGALTIPPVNIFDHFSYQMRHIIPNRTFPIQINHYVVKSYHEYQIRKQRGDVFFTFNPHDEKLFRQHDSRCTDTDYSLYRYLTQLKLAVFRILPSENVRE